ncbi:210_t:CDS:2 [Entrophospora sp. SA101]|nr:13244_t:CDS:2 [Entrophospora sp. SA101]CAJ0912393.1 210_t:CDS:2 [Entrophospora sp. SA101]
MKNFVLLLIITLILLIIKFPLSINSQRNFTYVEQETGLQVFRLINYDDGTIIIRVTRDTLCPETLIRLRVISKDGDVKSVTFGGLPGTPCTLASEIYPLKIDYFLLTYFNCEKSFCNHYGMILSWDGAIVESDINLSDVQLLEPLLLNKRVQSKTVTRYPGLVLHVVIDEQGIISWREFDFSKDATKSKLLRSGNSEKSSTYEFTVEDFELLPIKNGAYAITIAYNLSTNIGNGTIYEVETYIIPPLTSLKNNLTKFTLYKSEDDLQEIRLIGCHDNIVAGTSNSSQSEDACFLEIEKSNKFSWMQLSFSTEGVTNPLATFGNDSFYDTDTKERIYSVMGMSRNNTDNYMVITINTSDPKTAHFSGYIYNESNRTYTHWGFPEGMQFSGLFKMLPNDTLIAPLVSPANSNFWSLESTVINVEGSQTHSDFDINANIMEFNPKNGTTVPYNLGEVNVTISSEDVVIGSGNIVIYQLLNNNETLLRQTTPVNSPFVYLEHDTTSAYHTILHCSPLLSSTLNQANGNYLVHFDNSLLMTKENTSIPIQDISFTVGEIPPDGTEDEFEKGIFRLSVDGSELFKTLKGEDRDNYFFHLKHEMAQFVPIKPSRLTISNQTQIDSSSITHPQVLITFIIAATENDKERSAKRLLSDMNTMITNKQYTNISGDTYLDFLDTTYGVQEIPKGISFSRVGFKGFIALFGLLAVSIMIYLAFRRHKGFPFIFWTSLGIIILSGLFNCIASYGIIIKEIIHNPTFKEWFKKVSFGATSLIVIAGIDAEILGILSSKVTGFKLFSAPISDHSISLIFWSGTINLFIEDAPQFIILDTVVVMESVFTTSDGGTSGIQSRHEETEPMLTSHQEVHQHYQEEESQHNVHYTTDFKVDENEPHKK